MSWEGYQGGTATEDPSVGGGGKSKVAVPRSDVRPTDILCGKGVGVASWPGTRAFRRYVWKRRQDYARAARNHKKEVAKNVVRQVCTQLHGRFLEYSLDDDLYYVVSYEKSVLKTLKILQDKRLREPSTSEAIMPPGMFREQDKKKAKRVMKASFEPSVPGDSKSRRCKLGDKSLKKHVLARDLSAGMRKMEPLVKINIPSTIPFTIPAYATTTSRFSKHSVEYSPTEACTVKTQPPALLRQSAMSFAKPIVTNTTQSASKQLTPTVGRIEEKTQAMSPSVPNRKAIMKRGESHRRGTRAVRRQKLPRVLPTAPKESTEEIAPTTNWLHISERFPSSSVVTTCTVLSPKLLFTDAHQVQPTKPVALPQNCSSLLVPQPTPLDWTQYDGPPLTATVHRESRAAGAIRSEVSKSATCTRSVIGPNTCGGVLQCNERADESNIWGDPEVLQKDVPGSLPSKPAPPPASWGGLLLPQPTPLAETATAYGGSKSFEGVRRSIGNADGSKIVAKSEISPTDLSLTDSRTPAMSLASDDGLSFLQQLALIQRQQAVPTEAVAVRRKNGSTAVPAGARKIGSIPWCSGEAAGPEKHSEVILPPHVQAFFKVVFASEHHSGEENLHFDMHPRSHRSPTAVDKFFPSSPSIPGPGDGRNG